MTSSTDYFSHMIVEATTCPIWGTECQEKIQDADSITVVASPRAGGDYVIDRSVFPDLRQMHVRSDSAESDSELANILRARLTTILVRQRQLGNYLPRITASTFDAARSASRLPMEAKLANLLRFMVNITPRAGEYVYITNDNADDDLQHSLAVSESTGFSEVAFLTLSLQQSGWVEGMRTGGGVRIMVTASGYSAVEEILSAPRSDQCFVALWFNQETNALYDNAIAPAVRAAGYQPARIDRQTNFLGKIDDQIIAEIRRSTFVIADFTHDERGARGSVYYEAGFAHGLDIPVIFTCRDDQIDDLHFDTNHFLHLAWPADSPEALIEPLKTRILANIGAGPLTVGPD